MLPAIQTILFCADLSPGSMATFRHATAIAKATGATIHILHVVERLSEDAIITLEAYLQDPIKRDAAIHERVARARSWLASAQDTFWEGVSDSDRALKSRITSLEVVEASPAETILKRSRELPCDLIIMGSHDQAMSASYLGSVAKSVVRHSKIPTLLVPLPPSGLP